MYAGYFWNLYNTFCNEFVNIEHRFELQQSSFLLYIIIKSFLFINRAPTFTTPFLFSRGIKSIFNHLQANICMCVSQGCRYRQLRFSSFAYCASSNWAPRYLSLMHHKPNSRSIYRESSLYPEQPMQIFHYSQKVGLLPFWPSSYSYSEFPPV